MKTKKRPSCACCEKPAMFFHSKCCGAHLEGIITKEGGYFVVCEECGKLVGELKR